MRGHLQSTRDDGDVGCRRVRCVCVVVAVLAVLTAVGVRWADASYERTCSADELISRRAGVCGSRLADVLRVVCRSVYNKRSADCELLQLLATFDPKRWLQLRFHFDSTAARS